jgi:hypothetical protein
MLSWDYCTHFSRELTSLRSVLYFSIIVTKIFLCKQKKLNGFGLVLLICHSMFGVESGFAFVIVF